MIKGLEDFNYVFPNECEYTCNEDIKYSKSVISIKNKLQALEIIANKEVDIKAFNDLPNLEEYNYYCSPELTREEYEALKEVLEK